MYVVIVQNSKMFLVVLIEIIEETLLMVKQTGKQFSLNVLLLLKKPSTPLIQLNILKIQVVVMIHYM